MTLQLTLNDWSQEKQLVLFSENINVSRRETVSFEENKINCFPKDQSVICFTAGNFEAGNSLNLALTALVGQHSRLTVHCYTLTS